jgi:uncharacterized protein (TIGR02300 family)
MGLGLKRTCGACDAKFYDLEKSPIICPKCGKATRIGYKTEGEIKNRICKKCKQII